MPLPSIAAMAAHRGPTRRRAKLPLLQAWARHATRRPASSWRSIPTPLSRAVRRFPCGSCATPSPPTTGPRLPVMAMPPRAMATQAARGPIKAEVEDLRTAPATAPPMGPTSTGPTAATSKQRPDSAPPQPPRKLFQKSSKKLLTVRNHERIVSPCASRTCEAHRTSRKREGRGGHLENRILKEGPPDATARGNREGALGADAGGGARRTF